MKPIAILAGTGLLLLLAAILGHEPPAVEIHNRSGEPVRSFTLRVGPEAVTTGELPAGTLDRHSVPVRREGPLLLELRFASGHESVVEAGWFNPAQSTPARIAIVGPDSVALRAW
jgi:hypothetical protein